MHSKFTHLTPKKASASTDSSGYIISFRRGNTGIVGGYVPLNVGDKEG